MKRYLYSFTYVYAIAYFVVLLSNAMVILINLIFLIICYF